MEKHIVDKIQQIANRNSGRAAQMIELSGVNNNPLKRALQKLILHTVDDVLEIINGGDANEK